MGLAALFWDTDPSGVDTEIHRDFVIGRILSVGTLEAIRWARSRYGDDVLRDWIVRHEGRHLSGPQLRLWETVIGLPDDRVSALSGQMPLAHMLDCCQQRFAVEETGRVPAGLCFFDDANAEPMPVMLVDRDWEAVKCDLRDMVRQRVGNEHGGGGHGGWSRSLRSRRGRRERFATS